MKKANYFDKYGTVVSDDDAFDRHGALRNGFAMCVPTTMRDANTARVTNRITDGRTTDPMALNRPGFRVPVVNDRRSVVDAYRRYETQISNRYKVHDGETQCWKCFGSGEVNGAECETCHGSGVVSDAKAKNFCSGNESRRNEDSRSVTLDQAYRDYDLALSSACQNGRTG